MGQFESQIPKSNQFIKKLEGSQDSSILTLFDSCVNFRVIAQMRLQWQTDGRTS